LSDAHTELIPQAVTTERIYFTYTGNTDVIAATLVWLWQIKELLQATTDRATILWTALRRFSLQPGTQTITTTGFESFIDALSRFRITGIRCTDIPVITVDGSVYALKTTVVEGEVIGRHTDRWIAEIIARTTTIRLAVAAILIRITRTISTDRFAEAAKFTGISTAVCKFDTLVITLTGCVTIKQPTLAQARIRRLLTGVRATIAISIQNRIQFRAKCPRNKEKRIHYIDFSITIPISAANISGKTRRRVSCFFQTGSVQLRLIQDHENGTLNIHHIARPTPVQISEWIQACSGCLHGRNPQKNEYE